MPPDTAHSGDLISCPDCDLLLPDRPTADNQSLHCPRCLKTLSRPIGDSTFTTLVLAITGLLLYLPAMLLPLMTFESFGFSDSASLVESILSLFTDSYYLVASMIALSAVIFPLVLLSTIFLVTFNIYRSRRPPYLKGLFRTYLHLEEWAMVEVYLLGIMITIIKMGDTTEIDYHWGIVCFVTLVLLTLGISTVIDRKSFWKNIDNSVTAPSTTEDGHGSPRDRGTTGAERGLISCPVCDRLSPISFQDKSCPRCGSRLHLRKPASVTRTWALVVTAVILLFPANILPIMDVKFLGIPKKSTILDGIIYFFEHGSYVIGLIILIASILVPLFKVIGLSILLLTTRPSSTRALRQKTRMYRLIVFIGRWSMLDVFVIALLTSLVDFGFFTTINAAPAATYFCVVVAATMLAAITFDPRVMWDKCARKNRPAPQINTQPPADKP